MARDVQKRQKGLGEDEILAVDAGLKIGGLQEAKFDRYVLRLVTNFTARWNSLPEHHKGRKHKDKTLAATFPPIPTDFWDRKPKRTPGHLRRTLIGKPFPKDAIFPGQFREKKSVTAHLPKENLAWKPKTLATTCM